MAVRTGSAVRTYSVASNAQVACRAAGIPHVAGAEAHADVRRDLVDEVGPEVEAAVERAVAARDGPLALGRVKLHELEIEVGAFVDVGGADVAVSAVKPEAELRKGLRPAGLALRAQDGVGVLVEEKAVIRRDGAVALSAGRGRRERDCPGEQTNCQ